MLNTNIKKTNFSRKIPPNDAMRIQEVSSFRLKALVFCSRIKFVKPLLLFIGALFTFAFAYCIYGKAITGDNITGIVYMVDHVAHVLITLSNMSTISACLRYKTCSKSLWKFFRFIDSRKINKKIFRKLGISICLCCMIAAGCDTYFWAVYQGWESVQYYVLRDLQFLIMNLTLYSIAEIAYYMKVMFSGVNRQLFAVYSEYIQVDKHTPCNVLFGKPEGKIMYPYRRIQRLSTIKRIRNYHNQLCAIVEDFNYVFGLVLFVAALNLVSNIVWSLTMIVEQNIPKLSEIVEDVDTPLSCTISSLTMHLLWISLMIVHAVLIGYIGGSLTAEGHITINHCYKILHQQKLTQQDEEELGIKNVLTVLVKQAETRCPMLSADGFFSINLNILGMVASNVFAYTIVIIQFICNNNNNARSKLNIKE